MFDKPGLDHILIGVPSLDGGIASFEKATGVAPTRGGRHPLRGTENALVSLGGNSYLEIIAPQANASDDDPFVKYLRHLATPVVVGWAVHVEDISDATDRLKRAGFQTSLPQPGSRITPDGKKLEWTTFEVEQPEIETAPFFIRWSESTVHPSKTEVRCSLVSFQIEEPKASDLDRLLSTLNVAVPVRNAPRSTFKLTIQCGDREATFHGE
ncbi:MAG TPA: VOC family protein [Vicinamibacterales bacterium]